LIGRHHEAILDYWTAPRDSLALLVQEPSAGYGVAGPLGLGGRVPGDTRMRDPRYPDCPTIEEIAQSMLDNPANAELLNQMEELAALKNHGDNHEAVNRAVVGED